MNIDFLCGGADSEGNLETRLEGYHLEMASMRKEISLVLGATGMASYETISLSHN